MMIEGKIRLFAVVYIIFLMLVGALLPMSQAADLKFVKGFDKGPSYEPVVPLKRVTFVNFDENSYLDDYAYLASVPTAVFNNEGKLFSNPLLFYQDEYPVKEDKDRALNARQGIDYFMEDWMTYCNGMLDKMTLINVPKNKLENSWKAKDYATIESDNPYDIASKIALDEWSYSDNAVVAVIDKNFEKPSDNTVQGKVTGSISADKKTKNETFFVSQTNKLNPQFYEFDVPEGYKYIKVGTWFPGIAYEISPFIWVAIPSGDKDLQLYCRYDDKWMMVSAKAVNTNQWGPNSEDERIEAYIYKSGSWKVGITDFPTKADTAESSNKNQKFFRYGSWGQIFSALRKGVNYQTDIALFPGTEIKIPDNPPFECNNVKLKLTWNNPSASLGFSLIGPGGEVVFSVANESRTDYQEMNLDELGQCLPGESYSICVFTMDDLESPVNFNVEYSWNQRITKDEGDSLASATEGSVLASLLNAPLLYTSPSQLPQKSIDTLYKLGIENVYLVDIGNHLSNDVINSIKDIAKIKECYNELKQVYKGIMDITNQNDVIFTTIDPWSYWFGDKNIPAGETKAGLFIGPAAYCAAQHGSPVIIVDCEPQLSSAVVWHNEFWKRYASMRLDKELSISEMYLTGTRVYDFLKENDFDKTGMETMITVADQYDIGASWDRVFPGRATPGRIFGSPVDTAYWISHNVFYPALIFLNPGMNPSGVELINGSISHRRPLLAWGKFGLVIDRPAQKETYTYPVLNTYTSYCYRFNERSIKYYGTKYQTADGIIPGETNSFEAIDDGANLKTTGEAGAFYPDINPSEMVPFYTTKGGYSNVFSTNFSAVMEDLNGGVILWSKSGHGHAGYGALSFWDAPTSLNGILGLAGAKKESNPWRGYEVYLGSTKNPDTMTMEVHGIIPALIGNPNINGLIRTGVDWAPAVHPILDNIGKLLSKIPIIKRITPEWLKDTTDYEDGYINSVMFGYMPQIFHDSLEMDDALRNIHSVGCNIGDCTPMGTYLHLTLVRHGSVFQIIDPWATSWYSNVWDQSFPRDVALGDTVGQAYTKGISHTGILYISEPPQWWWDSGENVCFYGDPDLRMFVPGTDYSDTNHWTKEDTKPLQYDEDLSVAGHMPFGVSSYPHARQQQTLLEKYLFVIISAIIVLLVIAIILIRRKKSKKSR